MSDLIRALQGAVNWCHCIPIFVLDLFHTTFEYSKSSIPPAVGTVVPPLVPQWTLSFPSARAAGSPAQITDKGGSPSNATVLGISRTIQESLKFKKKSSEDLYRSLQESWKV